MTRAVEAVVREAGQPVGVNVLRNDARAAPAAVGLAGGARARLRRRRLTAAGSTAAAAGVLAVSVLASGGPGATTARPAGAANCGPRPRASMRRRVPICCC